MFLRSSYVQRSYWATVTFPDFPLVPELETKVFPDSRTLRFSGKFQPLLSVVWLLIVTLTFKGGKYYESLLGEANIVANAYSNFGKRVTNLKKKLEDKIPEMDRKGNMASISPMPR